MVEPFLAIRAATIENFWRGQKSLLATIVTSSMRSQPWCDFLGYDQLTNIGGWTFFKVGVGHKCTSKKYGRFFQAISFNNGPNTDCV